MCVCAHSCVCACMFLCVVCVCVCVCEGESGREFFWCFPPRGREESGDTSPYCCVSRRLFSGWMLAVIRAP
uniref:Secreted protein n=1 Tax=Anguilla anguilla TaxID=7936 RepID=A0A0E9Q1H3_ANGAN